MSQDELPVSLQESLLALLSLNDKEGTIAAAQLKPEHFDGVYQEIARTVLAYRRDFGKAPGISNLDVLFGTALEKGERAPKLRRVISGIVGIYDGLNPEYIVSKTNIHIRKQAWKSVLRDAAERYQQGGDETSVVEDIERIITSAQKSRASTLDAGLFLNDFKRSLEFFEHPEPDYPIGITELDKVNIGCSKKEQLLYVAPKNSGKSWFCVHMGVQGLMHGASVLHITLEMPASGSRSSVAPRYMQRLKHGSWSAEAYNYIQFEVDEGTGRLKDLKTRTKKPSIVFTDQDARKQLLKQLKPWEKKLGRILVKEFPSGTLTMNELYGYLDYLESAHKFMPTMLIVDYPDLFKINPNNVRIETGRVIVNLRGIAGERHLSLITPTQGGRKTIGARFVKSKDVSEDISKVFTADNVLTYSATEAEQRMGLARLHVDHARGAPMGQTVILSQAYAVGQYVKSSYPMNSNYWDVLGVNSGEDVDDEEE